MDICSQKRGVVKARLVAAKQLNDEEVIQIKRVSKATTGGRRMSFRSIVVVGDGQGHVGIGFGRANEVASSIDKAKNILGYKPKDGAGSTFNLRDPNKADT